MPQNTSFAQQPRVPLAGSEKQPYEMRAAATEPETASTAAQDDITVSVLVRRKSPLPQAEGGKRLTEAQFAEAHGPDRAAIVEVEAFAREFGLRAEAPAGSHRAVRLTGTAAAISQAFGVTLNYHSAAGGRTLHTRAGAIMLPESLAPFVEAVLGLDNRPQAQAHFRVAQPRSTNTSYTPVQVAQAYGLPAGAHATGTTIAILELGGGYRPADLKAYFATLGLAAPTVVSVAVDKGRNTPGDANGADGEVMLDIEVCASVAAGAKIVVYFAPNTDQGFIDAISMAVHDTTHKPSVLSISWGGPESSWTAQARAALDSACQAAALVGVTITVAAGDNGSGDGASGTNVDFPASSPHVLACGGTKLGLAAGKITSEVVWNETAANEGATGGGVSTAFPLPGWQAGVGVPGNSGRGVPDVAGDADPATGYTIRVDGQTTVIGGTSAVAPLWAALIAVANSQRAEPVGFVNPALYAAAKTAFHDITEGSNGAYSAGPGWDACTGLGSPAVAGLLKALAAVAASG